jgi:hypothetical protein
MSSPHVPLHRPDAEPPQRLTVAGVLAEIADELFSLDRGLPHTWTRLLGSPGATARRYIEQRDPRLVRPFRLALLMLALAALLLHFSGAGADFQSGLSEGAAAGGDGNDTLVRAVNLLFTRFDITLVLCWVPAVALAFQASFRQPRPNLAEGVAFSLYLLAGLLPIQMVLLLGGPTLGLQPLGWMLGAAMAWLGWAGFGYARPPQRRALAAGALVVLSLLTFLMIFMILLSIAVLLAKFGLLPD